eukprot:m.128132 g.128132  ORF g.128132 m.128132 type:complete len:432 (+) comp22276_c0_seq2:412-1707(+)
MPPKLTKARRASLPPGSVGSTVFSDGSYGFWKDPMGYVAAKVEDHGAVFQCRIMNQSTIMVTSHTAAVDVLSGPEADAFSLPQGYSQFLDGIFGPNMMLQEGGSHHRLASLLHEVIGPDAISGGRFSDRINTVVDQLATFLTEQAATADSINLYDAMKQAATRASLSLFLGVDVLDHAAVAELTDLTKAHWHGIISMPVKLRIPGLSFMQSKRSAAAGVADNLRTIIADRYVAAEEGGVARDESETIFDGLRDVLNKDETMEHTLLFISALIPKAVAAIMTQLILALDQPGPNGVGSLRDAVRADTACRDRVVQEVERCFSPFFACRRVVKRTVTVGGYVQHSPIQSSRLACPDLCRWLFDGVPHMIHESRIYACPPTPFQYTDDRLPARPFSQHDVPRGIYSDGGHPTRQHRQRRLCRWRRILAQPVGTR